MAEACAEILNVVGDSIIVPTWAIAKLRRLNFLKWNRERRKLQISTAILNWMEFLEQPEFRPAGLRAVRLDKYNGKSPDSGFRNSLVTVIGQDGMGRKAE
jgi:hypothetical protein